MANLSEIFIGKSKSAECKQDKKVNLPTWTFSCKLAALLRMLGGNFITFLGISSLLFYLFLTFFDLGCFWKTVYRPYLHVMFWAIHHSRPLIIYRPDNVFECIYPGKISEIFIGNSKSAEFELDKKKWFYKDATRFMTQRKEEIHQRLSRLFATSI